MRRIDWKPWVEISIGFAALAIGAAAVIYSIASLREDKNARLVEIGVAVLRADPQKEPSAASARKWALDLIDANAGGVKFTPQARADLLNQALRAELLFPVSYSYTPGQTFEGHDRDNSSEKPPN